VSTSVATLHNLTEIQGCAEQPIRNRLRIEQALTVYPGKNTERCASHLRFSRTHGIELDGRRRFIRCRDAMQRDLSKTFAAAFKTLPCADVFLLARPLVLRTSQAENAEIPNRSSAGTPSAKRLLRIRFRESIN